MILKDFAFSVLSGIVQCVLNAPLECVGMGSSSFLFQHVYPIRLLEAAELLEADQRKHEGGHSKETSSKGFY